MLKTAKRNAIERELHLVNSQDEASSTSSGPIDELRQEVQELKADVQKIKQELEILKGRKEREHVPKILLPKTGSNLGK